MVSVEQLLTFFRSEFLREERSGFARLRRVPDSRVEASLGWYQSLAATDRASFIDFCAHNALWNYWYVHVTRRPETTAYLQSLPGMKQLCREGLPDALVALNEEIYKTRIDVSHHPSYSRWRDVNVRFPFRSDRNVPMLRTAIGQYKVDKRRGLPSRVSEELLRFAESVKPVRTPQLRKRLVSVLRKFGYEEMDNMGGHRCVWEGQEFEVNADFGSKVAQLRYSVTPTEFRLVDSGGICFETVLGMGLGWWNYIVEENVDDVFLLFEELIKYAVDLPRRMRAAISE